LGQPRGLPKLIRPSEAALHQSLQTHLAGLPCSAARNSVSPDSALYDG
jgi:hypothetical protein